MSNRWYKIVLIASILLIAVLYVVCHAGDVITDFKDENVTVVNDRLRKMESKINNKTFRGWEMKKSGTTYTAETDGYVVAYTVADTPVYGYSNADSTPTTLRSKGQYSITMPVKKNERWQATGATIVQWIPFKQ